MNWFCSPDCYGQAFELVCYFSTIMAAVCEFSFRGSNLTNPSLDVWLRLEKSTGRIGERNEYPTVHN